MAIEIGLTEELRRDLKEALADMKDSVDIHVFIAENCEYCKATIDLVEAMVEASPLSNGSHLLRMHLHHWNEEKKIFEEQGVERVPTVTLLDGMIKYTGIPAGEEIRGLVETIIRVSEGDSGLEEETIKKLREEITEDVYIENIVTPQCPYCPYAALLINMFAFEIWKAGRTNLVADTVEAYENPDIADKYHVMSVPALAVNGTLLFVGVPYELDFIERIIGFVKRGEKVEAPIEIEGSITRL